MNKWAFSLIISLAQILCAEFAFASSQDEHQIAAVMKQQFGKTDSPIAVDPIAIEGNYAVADWLQSGRGGRALLHKMKGQWFILICGGHGLTEADVLEATGMKRAAAIRLATTLRLAESKLSPSNRKLVDGGEGMVKLD